MNDEAKANAILDHLRQFGIGDVFARQLVVHATDSGLLRDVEAVRKLSAPVDPGRPVRPRMGYMLPGQMGRLFRVPESPLGYAYAIRDADLQLFCSVAAVFGTLCGFAAGDQATGLAAQAATNFLTLAYSFRKKGFWLEADEYTILAALKARAPLTDEQLANELASMPGDSANWRIERVREVLGELENKVIPGREPMQLAARTNDGAWVSTGV